jgi:gluconokinase
MKVPGLRSPRETVGGIVYFGRLLDKIRLHAQGKLPADYLPNLGKGFDAVSCGFLKVGYADLAERVKQGGSDEEILQWCFTKGRKPTDDEITMLNDYLSKRGWRDARSTRVAEIKKEYGTSDRDEIQTFFDLIDVDEGRDDAIPS